MIKHYLFENVYNLRDLGGYVINEHQITKWQVFLRGDDLSLMNENDQQLLKRNGLTTVIDLRSAKECNQGRDPFENDREVSYIHCPVTVADAVDFTVIPKSLEVIYETMLNDRKFVGQVFEQFAKSDGMILFHCAAGKDRTGIIAFLLLKLMGASDQDIISDYQQSSTHLLPKFADIEINDELEMYIHLMHSEPETIRQTITYFTKQFGDIKQYLLDCGITSVMQGAIIKKFTQQI